MPTRLSRRTLLKAGAIAGAGAALPWAWLARPPVIAAESSPGLRKFTTPLRKFGSADGIPFATPDGVRQPWWKPGVTHYTIDIAQFRDQLHPDLPNPTRLWGFGQGPTSGFRHLGAPILAKRGAPVQVTYRNNLPSTHILPVDRTLMGTENADNRSVVHLHGAFVEWTSDGGPFGWWDPNGNKGPSFLNNSVLGVPNPAPNQAEFYYPNNQGSRLLWYHDHALGTTRLNVYAGLVTGYVLYDDYELSLGGKTANLPGPTDPRTIYLAFQDKFFLPGNIATVDPTWLKVVQGSQPGDLWYPHEYDPGDLSDPPPPSNLLPKNPSCVPEFFGDTALVNGTAYPFLEVEQRQYRFRLLNGCNSRFLNPRLVYADASGLEASAVAGPPFVQIGNECGFLPNPVFLSGVSPAQTGDPTPNQLLLAPAERADLIVDFRDVAAGSKLILFADAPAPYPDGDPANDHTLPEALPGFGPNTRTLLQIRVKARVGAADPAISLPATFTPTDPFMIKQSAGKPTAVPKGVPVRRLTLNETFDVHGRLIQFLGTDSAIHPDSFGREYVERPTEIIPAGSTEVWELLNLTGDTHPIHFHLVNVQVLSRQPFDADNYAGGAPTLTGPAIAPDPNELGYKETVRMNPGTVTRVIMKFTLPAVPFTVPASPRLINDYGIQGAEYVYHCHILEHEEHDMMRPIVVV